MNCLKQTTANNNPQIELLDANMELAIRMYVPSPSKLPDYMTYDNNNPMIKLITNDCPIKVSTSSEFDIIHKKNKKATKHLKLLTVEEHGSQE